MPERRSGADRRASGDRRHQSDRREDADRRESRAAVAYPPDVEIALDDSRRRFAARFPDQCDSMAALIDGIGFPGSETAIAALEQVTHRLNGLAGTIGFPTVSARAADLERIATAGADQFDWTRAHGILDAMRDAFARELAAHVAQAVAAPPSVRPGAKILVAHDNTADQAVISRYLEDSGYVPITVMSSDVIVDTARATRPALILLAIALPPIDGYTVCRRLKADPDLAGTPVILMSSGEALDITRTSSTLGGDEFLNLPVDARELAIRLQRLLERRHTLLPAQAPRAAAKSALTYDVFLDVAREEVARSAAALAVMHVADRHRAVAAIGLRAELRGRDAIAVFGPTRLLVLMPQMTAAVARERIELAVDVLRARGVQGICAGVAATDTGGAKTVAGLIAEADEALVHARASGERATVWTRSFAPKTAVAAATILLADDDPEVAAIVDAHMRGVGYETIIAFDGEQALAAVMRNTADVVVLDLMLPKLTGFEILAKLKELESRPRVIVLSARGREDDVTHAFQLGADDYMTKPFSPQELMARVARLLR